MFGSSGVGLMVSLVAIESRINTFAALQDDLGTKRENDVQTMQKKVSTLISRKSKIDFKSDEEGVTSL